MPHINTTHKFIEKIRMLFCIHTGLKLWRWRKTKRFRL